MSDHIQGQGLGAVLPTGAAAPRAGPRGILTGVSDDSQQTPSQAERDTTSPDLEHHSGAVERARADLAAGRAWKARDRLTGFLRDEYDDEALELLGEVHHTMGDLPAAGAAWFGTARRGRDVDEAIEAWRERYDDHFPEMWRSLPRTVREQPGNKRVEALRRRAEQTVAAAAAARPSAGAHETSSNQGGGGPDAAVVIAGILAVVFLICAVIGFVTLLRWIIPG